MNLTFGVSSGEKVYTYQCLDLADDGTKLHPECGDDWHAFTESALQQMRESGDPELYFIISHIEELDHKEWDWEHPVKVKP